MRPLMAAEAESPLMAAEAENLMPLMAAEAEVANQKVDREMLLACRRLL